ncbi:MAG: valine--tRNA ligase [Pelagibacteraceae bacterium TMED237]|nr:valine--tRNA ligase [Candidatus Neomarinimicrobiota bacterium]OUW96668.1 MAG: valine--tRNA ligase [Pelagibacteraceae bacterium TMED237]
MSKKELSKVYEFSEIEPKWYDRWEKESCFTPKKNSHETFTIMIPPPNVTGILHIGHILNNTIQDILIRKARMEGKSVLWQPGTDHASIATEAKVTKMLESKGINKKEIGREKFLEYSMEWKEKYGGTILKQLRRLGASCDWSKTKFTMDPEYSKSVTEAFVRLYKDGLIYKGKRMVNWDPVGMTALSDEEVLYKQKAGKLWHLKYPVKDSEEHIIVATTRPETMLGDTGIAVNPNDSRYKKLIGKSIVLPIVNREIPVFSDEYVDMDFGTGCVKVTPAHDPNDFEMGKRNNLDIINIMNKDASLNDMVPKDYIGLDRYDARRKVIEQLETIGLIDKVEDYNHQVGHSERTDAVIEPYLSTQWFLKMEDLSKPALKAVNSGEINFYPKRWTKTYNHWLENIKDWCISRQLWWGHRIPVWYKGEEIYCGIEAPKGAGWKQEEDVLDTWFSSWLWPFATLGWPEKNENLNRFYPTQDLATGPDIIFFWVARMIMGGYYFMDEKPFSNVYFNGIIRDSKGRKMSKSLGNSPDPLDLMDDYGVDALRVSLLMIAPQGLDILFSEDRIDNGRNFMNKLWNSARFVLMNIEDSINNFITLPDKNNLDLTDKWILSKLNNTIIEVNKAYVNYRMNDAVKVVYDFVYSDFCDWYIEFSKTRFYGNDDNQREIALNVSVYCMRTILKLLHPYTPYITEELWSSFSTKKEGMIILESWPKPESNYINKNINKEVKLIQNLISAIRNLRVEMNISPGIEIDIVIKPSNKNIYTFKKLSLYISRLAKVANINIDSNSIKPKQSASIIIDDNEVFIPLKGIINIDVEISRLKKQIDSYKGRLNNVNKKLNNESFLIRAPKDIVDNEKKKRDKYNLTIRKIEHNLKSLDI